MNNTEKTKVFYRKANKLANSIYKLFDEAFAELPIVVYCVSVKRWNNSVGIDVWVTIGHRKVDDEQREIVGNVCESFLFTPWLKDEKAADFLNEIKEEIKPFVRNAKSVQEIVNKNKEQ